MTLFVICLLSLVLLLQTVRSVSGTRLVVASVLTLGLLWPMTKFLVKGEVAHQVVHKAVEKLTEEKKEDKEQKPSLACRFWEKVDQHKKNGLVRDRIRAHCEKEEEE